MTNEELRSLVIECLKMKRPHDQRLQISYLFQDIAQLAKKRNLKCPNGQNAWNDDDSGTELQPSLHQHISDIVWDLIVEGVLRPGDGIPGGKHDLPGIHLTNSGKLALQGHLTPYDPDGYLKAVTVKVPTVDPIIVKYIAESAETLRRNCFLSSTITLGCASEKAFLLLLDTYRDALKLTDQAAFDKALGKTRGIKQQHEAFMKEFEAKLKPLLKSAGKNSDWLSMLNSTLAFVFTYFRETRNTAGHPTGITLSREELTSHLIVFPAYLRVLYDCIEWVVANKPL